MSSYVDGRAKHPLYALWNGVRSRCGSPKSHGWANYGGRGITMQVEWTEDFWVFAEWIESNLGPRPEGFSLDRINNEGNYEKGNLRWADAFTQCNNTRRSIAGNKPKPHRHTTYDEIKRHWDEVDASSPV